MNVSEDALRTYIDLFHQTLESTAQQFLPAEHRNSLLHLSLLPARIVGYVSTQFGVGIEYVPSVTTSVETVRGSARIEDLFVRAPTNARHRGPMIRVQEGPPGFHTSGGIFSLTLQGGFPFRLAGSNASFRMGKVAFKIGTWSQKVEYAEVYGNRTAEFWSAAQAVARAKDEVLAGLVQVKRAQEKDLALGDYIARFKERIVLLLGDYDAAGMKRLDQIRQVVASHGYEPILIKDIPDQPVQDLPQKVMTIGGLARFVIVDDSSRSGHLMEVQLCKSNNWITVLLRHGGKGGSWMTAGASVSSNAILEQSYDDDNYKGAVSKSISWAEAKIQEFQRKFDATYPWRIPSGDAG